MWRRTRATTDSLSRSYFVIPFTLFTQSKVLTAVHCFEYCWPLQLWPWLWAMNIQDQFADCGKEFSSRLCFNKHYREYHQKNESNWQCQQRLWKSHRGQGLLWCVPGLRGWSTGGSSQGHLGGLKSILLRQNKHSHPLIYMRGMKSDDLFAIVDNWAISMMVFGKNVSGSNPLENMTYPLFPSPTFYMSGAELCRSWEKAIIEKIIQPKRGTLAVVQQQFLFLCSKYMRTISIDNKDDCNNMFSSNSISCATKYVCKIWQRITTKTTFGNRSWIAAQEIEQPNPHLSFYVFLQV